MTLAILSHFPLPLASSLQFRLDSEECIWWRMGSALAAPLFPRSRSPRTEDFLSPPSPLVLFLAGGSRCGNSMSSGAHFSENENTHRQYKLLNKLVINDQEHLIPHLTSFSSSWTVVMTRRGRRFPAAAAAVAPSRCWPCPCSPSTPTRTPSGGRPPQTRPRSWPWQGNHT